MGSLAAQDMAAHATLEQALVWHLQSNHYPPVPVTMVPVCVEAIEAIEDGDTDRRIELPEGTLYRGQETAPAWAIAEAHHLDAFIAHEPDDDVWYEEWADENGEVR